MKAAAPPSSQILTGPLSWVLAWRFLRGQRSRLLDGTARAALLATALGVTAMVIAMALMTGYREDLQAKLIRGNAAVVAYPVGGADSRLTPKREAALRAVPGVVRIGRVAYGQGSLASDARPQGLEVVLRGVDPGGAAGFAAGAGGAAKTAETTGAAGATGAGGAVHLGTGADGLPRALLGADLARRLEVAEGGTLRLVALGFAEGRPRFRYQSLRVAGTFASGFAEFDRSYVLLDRGLVETLLGGETAFDMLEFALEDPSKAPATAERITTVLHPDFVVTDWQQLNRELFTALRLQQYALFLVLGLIVLVSTFNVASTLVVLVRERMRDIGVLGAIGLTPRALRRAFLLYGAILGFFGTLLGLAFGTGVSWVLTTFKLIRFDAEVAAIYFIDSVPFRTEPTDLAAIAAFALLVNLLACWLPSRRAGKIEPADALRYE
ncbi:MAG TPA: ABC transporter permease [Thermoanaerobaculia bacterium]|nr:ABC transporter permease [Thermoanaerobaculia bacterium]